MTRLVYELPALNENTGNYIIPQNVDIFLVKLPEIANWHLKMVDQN